MLFMPTKYAVFSNLLACLYPGTDTDCHHLRRDRWRSKLYQLQYLRTHTDGAMFSKQDENILMFMEMRQTPNK